MDISSVGNHEFDEGVTELRRMMNGGCHPVDGCFQQDATGKDIVFPGADYKYLARERGQGVDRQAGPARATRSRRSARPRSASSA